MNSSTGGNVAHAVGFAAGSLVAPLRHVPVIGIPLVIMLGGALLVVLVPVGCLIGLCGWLVGGHPTGRAAADPDKETPPPNWRPTPDPRRAETAVFDLKPADGPAEPASEPCCFCGAAIDTRDTFWMDIDGSRIAHLRCRESDLSMQRRHIDVEA